MRIVAIDLGKFKSVVCDYDSENGEHKFRTLRSQPQEIHDLLVEYEPGRVVIETGKQTGWVYDLATALGIEVQVANTNHDIWRWNMNTTKTDRSDALKLARLSALGQLPQAHIPSQEVRQWRSLIEYRHSLVERRTAIKNSIRAILEKEGIAWPSSRAGWSMKSMERLGKLSQTLGDREDESLWQGQLGVELVLLESVEKALSAVTAKLDKIGTWKKAVKLPAYAGPDSARGEPIYIAHIA